MTPTIADLLQRLLLVGTIYFLLLSISNIIWLRLSSRRPRITSGKKVSVLIPARNEAQHIGRCLESLITQTYSCYEIVVLDDRSWDDTWSIISDYQARYPGLIRAARGKPLPRDGWNGKPYAIQQLAEHATGEYLLMTDADTVHSKESISWSVTNIERHRADCVSGYVFQELDTFGERLIVPATYIMSTMILPLWLIAATRAPALSFAIGQLIMFRREAFESIGGYSAVSHRISDDIFIARELKRAGFRVIFLDIRNHVRCRMYGGYSAALTGITKNIYDFFKNRKAFFAGALTALVVFVLLPLFVLPIQLVAGSPSAHLTGLAVAVFQLAWALSLYDRGLRWWIPFLYPLLFLHLLYMAWRSFALLSAGRGVVWKGRTVR
jgi:chlorobactene glucosyltransferase